MKMCQKKEAEMNIDLTKPAENSFDIDVSPLEE